MILTEGNFRRLQVGLMIPLLQEQIIRAELARSDRRQLFTWLFFVLLILLVGFWFTR
jgi:hypothetical protein